MRKIIAALFICTVSACTSVPPTSSAVPAQPAMAFKFHGCSGELSHDDNYETTVTREAHGTTTTFQVAHAATCGLDARHPSYEIVGDRIELTYEMYSQNGAVVMCDCGYRSQYTFTGLPDSVKEASFHATFDEP